MSERVQEMTGTPLTVGIDARCLSDPFLRGFGRYTLELITALARRPNVSVIAFADADLVHDIPVPVVRFEADSEIVREQLVLPRLLRRHGVDVFLCPTNRGLPLLAPCPTVLTLHDAAEWDAALVAPRHGRSRMRFVYSSALSLASASLVITVSRASAAALIRDIGLEADRLRVVYEAADSKFAPAAAADDQNVLQRLGVGQQYVLYVGGFDKKKDVHTLLRAFASADIDLHLVLAGRITDEAAECVRMAAQLGIEDQVHLPGYVNESDLPALYRAAKCFVFPALAEGFGLPVVEAMACGTPVIVANAASLPEIIDDGGQVFEPSNSVQLATLLHDMCTSDVTRAQWSFAARRRAHTFSWDATAEATERVVRDAEADRARRFVPRRLGRLLRPRLWAGLWPE